VVKEYVARVYARDYDNAYELLSSTDRATKSRADYLRENSSFSGFTLELSRRLATYIEYPDVRVENQDGDGATVTVTLIVPDGNADAVREILFADPLRTTPWGENLSGTERSELLARLDRLHAGGQIPTFETEQTFDVVRERSGWRIFENWGESVRVHFSGEVKHELPWEFAPVQETVLAKPGETLRAVYRAKNLSDQSVTAKARHIDKPEEYAGHLDIVQCFCFVQQTLSPGEEIELPLVFRVAWDAPSELENLYVHYEFYPLESFPDE
jgi:hypothetical protein